MRARYLSAFVDFVVLTPQPYVCRVNLEGMTSTDAAITVTIAPHWVNGLLLRPAARPVVQIDGDDHVARWGSAVTVRVPTGPHRVRAFFRYRGTKSDLGATQREVDVAAGDTWHFVAKHGLTNGSGLHFTQVDRA